MSLLPPSPLGPAAQLGLPLLTSTPRSHLVEKAPTGELRAAVEPREQLAQQIAHLQERVTKIERVLEQQAANRWDRRLRRWLLTLWRALWQEDHHG